MTVVGALVPAGLVAAAAVVLAWPAHPGLSRLGARRRMRLAKPSWAGAETLALRAPRRLSAVTVLGAVVAAALTGGPTAAVAAGVYGALGARAVVRGARQRRAERDHASDLDALSCRAADLRAGTTLGSAPAVVRAPLGELVGAVERLAERTGAPAADLLDRVEADARGTSRAYASARAEAAGVRVTALLLAVLPLGGLGLGYSIGVDPLAVLLHTPVGVACALGAVALHAVGLLWSDRLGTPAALRAGSSGSPGAGSIPGPARTLGTGTSELPEWPASSARHPSRAGSGRVGAAGRAR